MRSVLSNRFVLVWLGLALPPLILRAFALSERQGLPSALDLRGALSDVGVSLLAAALIGFVGRLGRWLGVGLALVWLAIHYANFEAIGALGAVASYRDLHFLGNATFLFGSALHIAQPALLVGLVAVTVGGVWIGLGGLDGRSALYSLGASVAVWAGLLMWPPSDAVESWRQLNAFDYNARDALAFRADEVLPADGVDPAEAMRSRWPELAGDVTGRSILAPGPRARNVLLVVVESVTGGYLPSLAAHYDVESALSMPRLDAFARDHLVASTFLVNQVKTSRGLYTLLCGELPNLTPGVPKMTEQAEGSRRDCLPRVLREAGYATLYAQAAPLAFMHKGSFMAQAGFETVRGDAFFGYANVRTKWGVDDLAFYEQVVPQIEALDGDGRPWFVTTLNVGTHHPFTVPSLEGGEANRAKAVAYADRALGIFIDLLRERGLLDDTLLIVTTDEASGLEGEDGVWRRMTKNWGVLLAAFPGDSAARVEALYSQADVALSILDYLRLAGRGRHFFGRSLFRDYSSGRVVFFAHSNIAVTGLVDADHRVSVCMIGGCQRYDPTDGLLFGSRRRTAEWDSEQGELLRGIVRASRVRAAAEGPALDTRLIGDRIEVSGDVSKILSGGQHWSLGADEWLEVEVEVDARGSGGSVLIEHVLRQYVPGFRAAPASDRRVIYLLRELLEKDRTLRFHYTLAPPAEAFDLEARTVVRARGGGTWDLRFRKAQVRVRRGSGRPEAGFQVTGVADARGAG